jgi:hypothetical protein
MAQYSCGNICVQTLNDGSFDIRVDSKLSVVFTPQEMNNLIEAAVQVTHTVFADRELFWSRLKAAVVART